MPLTITQRPNQNNNWVAGFNPVVYKMQRKDYNITAVASSGGALQITVNTNLTTLTTAKGGAVVAGSVLWVTTDNGVYNGAYSVVSVTNAASSVVTFGASTYISAATTGHINLQQRTGYNLVTRIFAGNGVVSSSALFTMSFTPSRSGYLLMDVSQLRNYLSPEIFSALLTATNTSASFRTLSNPTTSYKAHIQFTEAWTSSAETETNDSANPFFIVHGAMQIGDAFGSYLKPYSDTGVTRKFLTKFIAPRIWNGKSFTISYIDTPNGTTRTFVKKNRYFSTGAFWGATYDLGGYVSGTPNPSIFENDEDGTSSYRLLSDIQDASGTFSWTGLTYTGTPSATASTGTSNGVNYFVDLENTALYIIKVSVTVVTAGVTINVRGKGFNGSNDFSLSQSASVGTTTLTFQGTPTLNTHMINISTTMTTSASVTINSVIIENIPTDGWIDYQLVTMTSSYTISEVVVSETLRVYYNSPCSPAIQLFWKNSLGGDSTYVFEYNQEDDITNSDGRFKESKLFAKGLTQNEVESLGDLIPLGDAFDIPITELTSSINKTQGVIGQQVYAVNDDNKLFGVVVTNYELSSLSRAIGTDVSITIRYPETFFPQ